MRKWLTIGLCLCGVAAIGMMPIRGRGIVSAGGGAAPGAYDGFPTWPDNENNLALVPFTNAASPWLDVGYQTFAASGNDLTDQAATVTRTPYTNGIGAFVTLDATGSITGAVAGAVNIAMWVNSNDVWRLYSTDGTNQYVNGVAGSFAAPWTYADPLLTVTGAYDYGMVIAHDKALDATAQSNLWVESRWANPSNYQAAGATPIPGGFGWTQWDYDNRDGLYQNLECNLQLDTTFVAGGNVQNSTVGQAVYANSSGGGAVTQTVYTDANGVQTGIGYGEVSDSIVAAANSDINGSEVRTIMFWMRGITDNYLGNSYMMSLNSLTGGANAMFALRITSTTDTIVFTDGAAARDTGVNVTTNWQHVCVVLDGSKNLYIYVDGQTTSVNGVTLSSINTLAGKPCWFNVSVGNGAEWQGYLDDCRIFNTNFTFAQYTNYYHVSTNEIAR